MKIFRVRSVQNTQEWVEILALFEPLWLHKYHRWPHDILGAEGCHQNFTKMPPDGLWKCFCFVFLHGFMEVFVLNQLLLRDWGMFVFFCCFFSQSSLFCNERAGISPFYLKRGHPILFVFPLFFFSYDYSILISHVSSIGFLSLNSCLLLLSLVSLN